MEQTIVDIIYADMIITDPVNVELIQLPNMNNLSERKQVETLQQFVARAIGRKNRKHMFLYAYYLGQTYRI
jgi:hypothetical protein